MPAVGPLGIPVKFIVLMIFVDSIVGKMLKLIIFVFFIRDFVGFCREPCQSLFEDQQPLGVTPQD
jgi:hypothetical protein